MVLQIHSTELMRGLKWLSATLRLQIKEVELVSDVNFLRYPRPGAWIQVITATRLGFFRFLKEEDRSTVMREPRKGRTRARGWRFMAYHLIPESILTRWSRK